jgi:hypothetical protein
VVEIDAVLKAEHSVEPWSDTQLCAIAVGAVARIDNSAAVLVLTPVDRCFRLLSREPLLLRLVAIVALEGNWDPATSNELALSFEAMRTVLSWSPPSVSSHIFRFFLSSLNFH